MGYIRFKVKRPLDWDGRHYERGDTIEIEEGHPRLAIETFRRAFFADGEAVVQPAESQDAGQALPRRR